MTLYISDQADEFRIEICGRFADSSVDDAATAWRAALLTNTPRRISVDITGMTTYDEAGCSLLREFYKHGTHIIAGTPMSLSFLAQISGPPRQSREFIRPNLLQESPRKQKRATSKQVLTMPMRAMASGE